MQLLDVKRYVEFKVYNVTKINNKYGFRFKLVYADGSESVKQKSGYDGKRIAKEERDNLIAELASGRYVIEDAMKTKDFLIEWLENVIKPRCTYSTYTSYSNIIRRHINPKIGNITLPLLNKGHLQEFYEDEASKYTASYRNAKAIIDSAMKYAKGKNLISINPTIGVKLPKKAKKQPYRTLNIDSKKTLTEEQLKILIKSAKESSIYMQLLFSSLMGLRISEVNGLKYSDVDFVTRKLNVQRQLGQKANSKKEDFAPKTFSKQEIPLKTKASYRTLDIPDIVFEAILEQKKIYEKNRRRRINDKYNPFLDEGYICCSSYGKPRSRCYATIMYKEMLKENNLPNIRWHDLRHTFATILIKNGFSIKAISKKMGHAKQLITVDVYGDKQEIMDGYLEKFNPFIDEVLPKPIKNELNDFSQDTYEIMIDMQALYEELTAGQGEIKDFSDRKEIANILNSYYVMIRNMSFV